MRLLFAGTPQVAVPSLDALEESGHDICAVLTRPDAAAGRGRRTVRSAVGQRADELGIPVLAPASPRDPGFLAALRELAPDCCPIVAYGALIPSEALSVPRLGWINLHFSLLPAWRGAAPVQHAVRSGDAETGATVFRLTAGLDDGPVVATLREPIGPRDTSGALLERLATQGARLLVESLDGLADGSLVPRPQEDDGVTYAPKIDLDDARVDWTASALDVDRLIRACTPTPGAWSTLRDERVKLGPVEVAAGADLEPGAVSAGKSEVLVGTATAPVRLGEVRPQGRKPMPAADWVRGLRLQPGERLR